MADVLMDIIKAPSGYCKKIIDTKGMPRCPDGYHRSPVGDCEKGSKVSSEKSADTDDDIDFTKTKKEKNKADEDNNPLNQIFKSNNNNDKQSNKEVNDDNTNYKDNRIRRKSYTCC